MNKRLNLKRSNRLIDLTGQKFCRLLVLKFAYIKNKHTYWKCRCDCGNEIIVGGDNMKRNKIRSCGCLSKEITIKRNKQTHRKGKDSPSYKHGLSKTKAYRCAYEAKRRAKKLNQTPYLTETENQQIINIYKKKKELGPDWHVDHIIPLNKNGLHHPDNLQIVTKKYNLQKGSKLNFRLPNNNEIFKEETNNAKIYIRQYS